MGILRSILDFYNINPQSKLPKSCFKNIKNVKMNLAYSLLRNSTFRFNRKFRTLLESLNRNEFNQ